MAIRPGSTRIQVTLKNELVTVLDDYCHRLGVSRSSYVSTVLAQNLDIQSQLLDAAKGSVSGAFEK